MSDIIFEPDIKTAPKANWGGTLDEDEAGTEDPEAIVNKEEKTLPRFSYT